MSEPIDTWLDPEREPEVLARIDQIESDGSSFGDTADVLWLANLARQLIALRIATRASVAANAQRVRDLEQGQGMLGAEQWTTERPEPGLYWICDPGKTNPKLAKVMKLEPDDPDDDGWTLETMTGARWRLTRYLAHHPLRFSPIRTPQPPTP